MREVRFWMFTLLIAGTLVGVLAAVLRGMETRAIESVREGMREAEQARREIPDLAQTLRSLKLITVEIRTAVRTESLDESWRGDVAAKVEAPVVLYYGVDLSAIGPGDLRRNPITGELTLRLPEPVRLATEVLGGDERADVKVTGLRLRDVAGEYHLGQARMRLYERARMLVLSGDERAKLERTTAEQVRALVRAVTGSDTDVRVEYVPSEIKTSAGSTP